MRGGAGRASKGGATWRERRRCAATAGQGRRVSFGERGDIVGRWRARFPKLKHAGHLRMHGAAGAAEWVVAEWVVAARAATSLGAGRGAADVARPTWRGRRGAAKRGAAVS